MTCDTQCYLLFPYTTLFRSIGRNDAVRMQARRRRRERQQNQRKARGRPELHTTDQGKSNTRVFFEEFLHGAVCWITEQSAVLRSMRQSSCSMHDALARFRLMVDVLSIKFLVGILGRNGELL